MERLEDLPCGAHSRLEGHTKKVSEHDCHRAGLEGRALLEGTRGWPGPGSSGKTSS